MAQDPGRLPGMVFRRFLRSHFVLLCELVRQTSCLVGRMYCSCNRTWSPFCEDTAEEPEGKR